MPEQFAITAGPRELPGRKGLRQEISISYNNKIIYSYVLCQLGSKPADQKHFT